MLALVIALAAAVVVGVVVAAFFGFVAAILPALAIAIVAYFLLVRRVAAQLQAAMQGVQASLMQKNIDQALVALEGIRARFGRWVFLLGSQVDGQIGSILYMKKDFEKARPHLERAFLRMWEPQVMLAILASGLVDEKGKGKGDLAAADRILEKAARLSPKQGLLWSTWAYLHWKKGDATKALEILNRGKRAVGEADPLLTQNLLALQNDKKMKMKGYGDPWYALHLEQHPMVLQAQRGGNVRFARR